MENDTMILQTEFACMAEARVHFLDRGYEEHSYEKESGKYTMRKGGQLIELTHEGFLLVKAKEKEIRKPPKFIDYLTAIGILAANGYIVSLDKKGNARQIVANGEWVTIPMFRDGATWKVKEEALEDWMDDKALKG